MAKKPLNLNPGSFFLTLEKEGGIVRAQTKNGGDDNFVRYILNELSGLRPGSYMPERCIIRYDMGPNRKMVEGITSMDNETTERLLVTLRKNGMQQSHWLSMADAVFCVLNNINLLAAASDNQKFKKHPFYKNYLDNFSRIVPDIFPKVTQLRAKLPAVIPGYFYATFGGDTCIMDFELTLKEGGLSFSDYIQRNLSRLEPGQPLPDTILASYELADITPLKDNPLGDANNFFHERLFPVILEQRCPKAKTYDMAYIIFCIKNNLNPATSKTALMK